jgi:hypothetical protein
MHVLHRTPAKVQAVERRSIWRNVGAARSRGRSIKAHVQSIDTAALREAEAH